MLFTHRLRANTEVVNDSPRQGVLTSHQAETIVNIAGLHSHDRVLYAGAADMMLEDAVKRRGTRLTAGRLKPWPLMGRNSADVAFCFLGQGGTQDTTQALQMIRHYLRPGGRVVMWATPDDNQHPAISSDHLKEMTAKAGFTSMIVGQLPDAGRREMLVATGVRH